MINPNDELGPFGFAVQMGREGRYTVGSFPVDLDVKCRLAEGLDLMVGGQWMHRLDLFPSRMLAWSDIIDRLKKRIVETQATREAYELQLVYAKNCFGDAVEELHRK